jgi:UDP-N-acetylglucosamine 2-epimerase
MLVMTVLSTRPEIIKLSRVMAALDSAEGIEHVVVHTSQNWDYELRDIFFEEMSIRKPDHALVTHGNTPTEMTADIMVKLEPLLIQLKPDCILILGDTNGCVATALVAKRHKIPLMHMEAGNRCFDERVPEEVNRRIVDQLSDINLPYSSIARENLLHDGLPSDRIIKTGSPQKEVLGYYSEKICASDILDRMGLMHGEYFLVSVHREENCTPGKFKELCGMLNDLADKYHQRIIISAHPRIASRLNTFGGDFRNEIEIYKPFGFFDYNRLQRSACCVLSDSGTITEESVLNSFPALNLRDTHERPEGMEEAAVMMTGFNAAVDCISTAVAHYPAHVPDDWTGVNVSQKVVRIILSYVDYVNRTVWRK